MRVCTSQHQRQPGPTDAGAGHIIDQHDVDLGVIDLDHLQPPLGAQPGPDLPEPVAGRFSPLTRLYTVAEAARRDPCPERLQRRRFERGHMARPLRLGPNSRDRRPLRAEKHLVNRRLDLSFQGSGQEARALHWTRPTRQQRRRHRMFVETAEQRVHTRLAQS